MISFLEVLIFLSPFLAFAGWRLLSPVLPKAALWAAGALVLALVLAAGWTASRPSMGPGQRYAPAEWQNGRIVPGHAVAP